jgi:hypothetical protein
MALPFQLSNSHMHLDPDFAHLTYGDQGQRAVQIRSRLHEDDLLVFYAGLADAEQPKRLVYALIGMYVIRAIVPALSVPEALWNTNAHTRRQLDPTAEDVVVQAKAGLSGRLSRCIPIGSFRERAYRVDPELLAKWGGLSVKDGFLQRSARLPELLNPVWFMDWFRQQEPQLIARNN